MGRLQEVLAEASSSSWVRRARAGRALVRFAEVPEAAKVLLGLLLDVGNTAVTRQTAEALVRAGTAASVEVLAQAVARAGDSHADWIQTGVHDALAGGPGAPAFSSLCQELVHDPRTAVRQGAAEILAWAHETEGRDGVMSTDTYTSRLVDRAAEDVREGDADKTLAVAVRSYAAFAVHVRFDDGMTEEVLPVLWSVIPEVEREGYPGRLEDFVDTYRERLVRLYAEYGPQSATAKYGRRELLAHPVSLIVLEQLVEVHSRYTLAARWNRHLPDRWLNDISTTWGIGELL